MPFSAKDKNEKPFAMAFIKLLNKNGTTLKDEEHELLLYKVGIVCLTGTWKDTF